MVTPMAFADCGHDLRVLGDLLHVVAGQLRGEAVRQPAADSSDLASAMFFARWATVVLVDGNTGANGLSLPMSA